MGEIQASDARAGTGVDATRGTDCAAEKSRPWDGDESEYSLQIE